jgi:hypothetical protein
MLTCSGADPRRSRQRFHSAENYHAWRLLARQHEHPLYKLGLFNANFLVDMDWRANARLLNL